LAQRDRKHRDKYTGGNKRHLDGVETITGTGETDQGVRSYARCHYKSAIISPIKQIPGCWQALQLFSMFYVMV
jgi:hypothetical protein